MTRTLEAVFTHRRMVVAPIVIAFLAALGFVLIQKPTYQSTATLWVNWSSGGTQSAADAEVATIKQLVATRSFDVSVADHSTLAQYLGSTGSTQITGVRSLIGALLHTNHGTGKASADTIYTYLSTAVSASSLGPTVVKVTVNGPTPEIAQDTASALISQLRDQQVAARRSPQQAQLAYYQTELKAQSAKVSSALAAVRAYLSAHPNLVPGSAAATNDAQYALLNQQAVVATQTYSQLLTAVNQLSNQIQPNQSLDSDPFTVTDTPALPQSVSRFGKKELFGLGAGILGGVLASALVASALVRMDTTIHLPTETRLLLGLEPAGSIPLVRMR